MRSLLIVGMAVSVLAACGSETSAPSGESAAAENVVMPENEDLSETPPPAIDCKDLQTVLAATSEPVPFTSLRGASTGPDAYATTVVPAGAKQCRIGKVEGSGVTPTVHAVNCTLFSAAGSDRMKDAELAKLAFDTARAAFTACLPADWTARDGTSNRIDATESMIYESRADAQRAMTASAYTYPVRLMKEWVEDASSAKTRGWHVTLDFQKDAKQ